MAAATLDEAMDYTSKSGRKPINLCVHPGRSVGDHNKYISQLYSSLELNGCTITELGSLRPTQVMPDILHLHWPDAIVGNNKTVQAALKLTLLIVLIRYAQATGTKFVWTVHNIHSHNQRNPWLERLAWRLLVPRFDALIFLSKSSRERALQERPELAGKRHAIIRHGHYKEIYPYTPDRYAARTSLCYSNEHIVLGFLGIIARYKGIEDLTDAMKAIPGQKFRLHLAGALSRFERGATAEWVSSVTKTDARITCSLGFVPDEAVGIHLAAYDLAIIPYRFVLNSGSAILALSCGCPVLMPASPAADDLAEVAPRGWVTTFEPPISPPDILRAVKCVGELDRSKPPALPELAWDHVGRRTAGFFRALVNDCCDPSRDV